MELALLELKVDTIQECTLLDARCVLPEVKDLVSEYREVADLIYDGNDLGFLLDEQGQGMPHFSEKFHAALAYEKCTRLGAALDIAQNLRCYRDFLGRRQTLEQECLRSRSLPSIAYGHKKCSQKYKIAPQDRFCNHYPPCREVWQRGDRVVKMIGYDAGEVRRLEGAREHDRTDMKYQKQ